MKDTLSNKARRMAPLYKALAVALAIALVIETMPLQGALALAAELSEGAQATQTFERGGRL